MRKRRGGDGLKVIYTRLFLIVGEGHSLALSQERKSKEATTMKRLLFVSVLVLALMATVLLAAGPVAAKATKTRFTASETWVEDISPGKEWYTGKDGKIYHVRGGESLYAVVATNPDVSGDEFITVNLDMKVVPEPVFITGPMWGTFRIENAGGYWEGTWVGVRDKRGYAYIEYVGSGGGGYAGLKIRVHNQRLNPDWTTPHSWTGYILDPGQ
jgi:hypothetical protein